jgi:hypothetical protein
MSVTEMIDLSQIHGHAVLINYDYHGDYVLIFPQVPRVGLVNIYLGGVTL